MTVAARKSTAKAKTSPKLTYHGVTIQSPPGRSRFTPEQIRKAVKAAIAKNPNALSAGK